MIGISLRYIKANLCVLKRNASRFKVSGTAQFERPTPIVILSGEGCSSDQWTDLTDHLSSEGYEGLIVNFPIHPSSFYNKADELHQQITKHKLTPPILIAHSISTYIAQKYLESYALSGLIMINPIPPITGKRVISSLYDRWKGEERTENIVAHRTQQSKDSSAPTSMDKLIFEDQNSLDLFLDNTENPDAIVNLERGSVPTLLITSDGDNNYLTETDISDLQDLHNIPTQDILHFGSTPFSRSIMVNNNNNDHTDHQSNLIKRKMHFLSADSNCLYMERAPMVTHTCAFNAAVTDWIELII